MKYLPKKYARALYELVEETPEGRVKDLVKKFAKTLAENGDLTEAGLVVEEFERIWRQAQGREKIEVTVAKKGEFASLKEKLKGDVQFKEDPKILGGVKIKIGDKLIDNTLRARISRLKESLGI